MRILKLSSLPSFENVPLCQHLVQLEQVGGVHLLSLLQVVCLQLVVGGLQLKWKKMIDVQLKIEITSIKLSISVRPFKPMNKLIGVPQPHLDEGFVMEYWIPQKTSGWTGYG